MGNVDTTEEDRLRYMSSWEIGCKAQDLGQAEGAPVCSGRMAAHAGEPASWVEGTGIAAAALCIGSLFPL